MFFRKYWIPLLVFMVAIVGVSLYYLQTRPPKEPILIVKPVEYEKPPAKGPVVEQPAADVGHLDADGTWHEGAQAPVPPAARVASDTGLQSLEMSVPPRHRDTAGSVPLPADLYDQNAWADYYAKAIPDIPANLDDEAAWMDYFDRVTIVKKPVDPTNTEDYRAYIDPLSKEALRVLAELEKLRKQFSALPAEAFPSTVNERARFFFDVERPYTLAMVRLTNESMRRNAEWHRRVDAYFEHGRR